MYPTPRVSQRTKGFFQKKTKSWPIIVVTCWKIDGIHHRTRFQKRHDGFCGHGRGVFFGFGGTGPQVWHRNDLVVLKDFFVWKIRHVIAFVNASVNGGFQSSMVHQFTSGKINDVAAGKEPKNQRTKEPKRRKGC